MAGPLDDPAATPAAALVLVTETGAEVVTETGEPVLITPGPVAALLAGTATLRLTASARFAPVAALLAGTATLRLTATGTLATRATLAGYAELRLTATGALQSPGTLLAGTAVLRLHAGPAALVAGGTPLAGSATLTLTASGTLEASRAILGARITLRLLAAGALAAGTDLELRALRAATIQRPVGRVEAPGSAPLPGVLRFTLESSLDTPADGWTAEVAGSALLRAPDDEALYQLPIGFLAADGHEVLAAHVTSGRILDRRLVGRADERRTYLRGVDALERTFRLRRRVRYVPEAAQVEVLASEVSTLQAALTGRQAELQLVVRDPTWPTPELEARAEALARTVRTLETGVQAARADEVPEKVGTWTASAIAADLVAGSGLTVSWECRDYTVAVPFEAVGTLYECLERLAEPWRQVPPFGVDLLAQGTVVRVRPRRLRPPPDLTLTVAESRLVALELGDRRRLPWIGTVELEGRLEPAGAEGGESAPGIGEPVLPVLASEMTTSFSDDATDLSGNLIGRVEGTRTYRMPDKLLIAYTERVWQRSPRGLLTVVKEEQGTIDYEPSHYGPQGPLGQPLPLAAQKLVDTLRPVPGGAPGALSLQRTLDERQRWTYDDRRFLTATTIERYKRVDTPVEGGGTLTSFPLAETITESRTIQFDGWVRLLVTRATYNPKTGAVTGSVTGSPQDQAGFPPGGPRRPFSFSTFISAPSREASEPGTPTPVRVRATLSTDPTAVPLAYANPNLSRADLEFILEQAREASGLVVYPLHGTGPALPDLLKGSAVLLTDFLDEDGVALPLEPALVERIAFDYQDTREAAGFTCALDAVFYRRE